MKQYLKLKLSQKLSPQQIQLMKLIQLPTIDFEQKIQRELEENPALEMGDNNEILTEDFSESNENEFKDEIDNDDINIEEYLNYDDIPAYKLNYNSNNDNENTRFINEISYIIYKLIVYLEFIILIRLFQKSNFLLRINHISQFNKIINR